MNPPSFRTRPIDRRDDLSRAEFERLYLAPSLPVVLAGVYPAAALARWSRSLETTAARVACVVARRGNVAEISDAERPKVADAERHPKTNEFFTELALAEVILRMRAPARLPPLVAAGETLYVFSVPWPAALATPRAEARGGPGLAELLFADRRAPQLLINGPGMLNRAHAHIHSYFLQHLLGEKRVRLFSPAATALLYHNGVRRSAVEDFDAVDLERFPRVAAAEAWEGLLAPGDVLFLPTYWWHEIRVDDLAVSMGTHAPASPLLAAAAAFQKGVAGALDGLARATSPTTAGIARLVLEAAAADLETSGLEDAAEHLRYTFDDPA